MSLLLLLAALAVPASAATAPSRSDYILEVLKSMRTTQASYMGAEEKDGGELLGIAVVEAETQIKKDEAAAPAAAVADPELEDESVKSLRQLASAYSLKQRSRFMRYVSAEYAGSTAVLEDALVSDFRAYNAIVLDLRPDRTTLAGRDAAIELSYNLSFTDSEGEVKKFEGKGSFFFRRDRDGSVRLTRMQPMLFGNTLPAAVNPTPGRQGAVVSGGGPTPGFSSSIQSGSAVLTQAAPGYRFDPPGAAAAATADVVKLAADFNARRGIVSIGACSLDAVTSVPSGMSGNFAPINAGECYGLKTATGKYAVMRVSSTSGSSGLGPNTVSISYLLQTNGTSSFR